MCICGTCGECVVPDQFGAVIRGGEFDDIRHDEEGSHNCLAVKSKKEQD